MKQLVTHEQAAVCYVKAWPELYVNAEYTVSIAGIIRYIGVAKTILTYVYTLHIWCTYMFLDNPSYIQRVYIWFWQTLLMEGHSKPLMNSCVRDIEHYRAHSNKVHTALRCTQQ